MPLTGASTMTVGVPVTRARRAALDEPAHIFGKARHVERPVLHSDIDVIGPDMRVLAPLPIGQHVAAMAAGVINRLVLLQKFDGTIDAVGHGFPAWVYNGGKISDTRSSMSTDYLPCAVRLEETRNRRRIMPPSYFPAQKPWA